MGATPVRSCLVCRCRAMKHTLVRVAVAWDEPETGTPVIDPDARQPGRGAYLCDRPSCLEAALAKGGARLARALRFSRAEVTVNEEAVRAGWRAAVTNRGPAQDVAS